mmetsp:Transcript_51733/g.116418  ORF Transcript_51733/g.116418 Transcript_51733/m.116418 type:complete len:430 (-) Transcript_51733:183-1472(-)|eukprot:CAMPEP_0197940966 /NCGR_PEP_ID=MMETSP1439-20131203/122081_1 /TAXON_ID=66791 /ORGANISM="Gonyaulax spinifera, Strain CCMP409" /LENGTH=429 /DNA_ID=CAMNT_0043564147 /DNA_START=89 /DNA_END=1378 /DNA_ORIENTATION=-
MNLAKDAASKAANLAVGGATTAAGYMPDAVMQGGHAAMKAMEDKAKEIKEMLENWIKKKVQVQIEKIVDRIPPIVKSALEDEYMPRMVSRSKDKAIDVVWPDFRDEIMWEVAVLMDGAPTEQDTRRPRCCLLRFLRYHLYPYDKTFWGQLRDPVYIIFTLISLLPVTGLCPLIFFFIFLIIDKRDEFQLLQFILQFKGTQFISHGIIRTIAGFFSYVGCVTAVASQTEHSCMTRGPGITGSFELIIGGWVLQIVLVWLAFLLLPCSEDKGRTKLKGHMDVQVTDRMKRKGGMIRYLLIWDMLVFVIACGVVLFAVFSRPESPDKGYKDWPVKHTFYACQVGYGIASMPFFFFTLPVIQAVLTHSVPTAYNRKGYVCKKTGRKETDKVKANQDFVTIGESTSMLDNTKAIFFGGQVSAIKLEGGNKPVDP